MRSWSAIVVLVLLAVAADAGDKKKDPAQIGNRDVAKGVNFYSIEREMALGRQLAQEVQRQAKMVEDPLITEYINRLGQNLVRNSDAKVPFTFQVIDDPALNAFALPGGYVFVDAGLIDIADEEDELAGAMAHEIAHVAARHYTRQASKAQIARVARVPLGGLLGPWGALAGPAIPMTFLSFDRHDEAEADYLGVQYMYAAGYDPTGAISIFEKMESLERRKPGAISALFSTHPPDADRIANTQREIQKILPAKDEYVITTSDYAAVRQRLIDMEAARPEPDTRPHLRIPAPAPTDAGGRPKARRP